MTLAESKRKPNVKACNQVMQSSLRCSLIRMDILYGTTVRTAHFIHGLIICLVLEQKTAAQIKPKKK